MRLGFESKGINSNPGQLGKAQLLYLFTLNYTIVSSVMGTVFLTTRYSLLSILPPEVRTEN